MKKKQEEEEQRNAANKPVVVKSKAKKKEPAGLDDLLSAGLAKGKGKKKWNDWIGSCTTYDILTSILSSLGRVIDIFNDTISIWNDAGKEDWHR